MDFRVNHPIIFVMVGLIIAAVVAQSVYFLLRALKRAKEKGMDMAKIKQTSLANKDTLLIVDDKIFLDIRCHIPRSPNKYIAAWRYLTGKEYY